MAQLTQVQRVFNLHLKKIPYLWQNLYVCQEYVIIYLDQIVLLILFVDCLVSQNCHFFV
jgi:hypothetical protein